VYNAAEALPNLINPLGMLPLLRILVPKARDVVSSAIVRFVARVSLVLFLLWLFGLTLDNQPSAMP
jgi:short subunit fatty acids transporter